MAGTDASDELFAVYHEGVAIQLHWESLPPLQRQPAVRLCALAPHAVLLLTADHSLYAGRLDGHTLRLSLERTQVLDVDYCTGTQQLFIVTSSGAVLMQQLDSTTAEGSRTRAPWQTLSFDPLELSEEGINIQRVCCSAHGVLFVTTRGEVYVMGSCGDVFAAEALPKHMRIFDDSKEVLDLAAGSDFFVALLKRTHDAGSGDPGPSNGTATGTAVSTTTAATAKSNAHSSSDAQDLNHELNSNASLRSSSSNSSHAHGDQFVETNAQRLLQEGYALLQTQVYTFGARNNGLLGTGDHIKRPNAHNVQKLDAVGVCGIAAGREHTVARTLDGRLYHWGLLRNGSDAAAATTDLSAPTEMKLDGAGWNAEQRTILAACCGDYETALLDARGELHGDANKFQHDNDRCGEFLTLQLGSSVRAELPLLLAAGAFNVHNRRRFQRTYHASFVRLRQQLQLLLQYRRAPTLLLAGSTRSERQLHPVCLAYLRILHLHAALLGSLEAFYRGDIVDPLELHFVRYHRECLALFADYTRAYCDTYAVNGFAEVQPTAMCYSAPLPNHTPDDRPNLAVYFQQPFHAMPYFVQFLLTLTKRRPEFSEHLLAWQAAETEQGAALDMATQTQAFWQRNNPRSAKLRHLRCRHRRVVLTSTQLKCSGHPKVSLSNSSFVLFSDCLCEVGGQVQIYPLVVLWLQRERGSQALRLVTPERTFTLTARTADEQKLWHEKLEATILAALMRPPGEKVPSARTAAYVFSKSHPKYANVQAYGRWYEGVLHGNCCLEYPDGRLYCGTMRKGEIDGYGKMVLPSVGLYEGQFRAGRFHGQGVYEMRDNAVYEGNFRDGLMHGHGSWRCNDYTYVGEYQANAKCGYGVLDDTATGDKYMGMFADNKRVGVGTCITMRGDYFEGIFANDALSGAGLAVFENGFYYEGELTMLGPAGKGTYYMPNGGNPVEVVSLPQSMPLPTPLSPSLPGELSGAAAVDVVDSQQLVGNVLTGQLGGGWDDVRVVNGGVSINQQFPKYPRSIGELVVDNNRKWWALFRDFEEQLLEVSATTTAIRGSTKHLWSCIAVYMTTQRDRERKLEQQQQQLQHQDTAYQTATRSYFAKNISLGFASPGVNFDKLSIKSTHSLQTLTSAATSKSSKFDLNASWTADADTDASMAKFSHSHSQETLYDADLNDLELLNPPANFATYHNGDENNSYNSFLNAQLSSWANDSNTSMRSSFDSVLNLSETNNNNTTTATSCSTQNGLDFVPSFGITGPLTAHDVGAIKDYLVQAFKDRHHPLFVLNQRIANCFYTSYGCWKVKPTPILAKQAMREWESISKRVYRFVRKMFPALPEDYHVLESTREVVSHITLLYPIVLSEGIYSTLFVLYANKYSRKDELYRQNLLFVEKLHDHELAQLLSLESSNLPIVRSSYFGDAIQTLKQLQEKYSPKAMLTVIENCVHQITEAHRFAEMENSVVLAADSMMPLTLFLVLRAAVPHLGAELALLDDLTDGANFQFEMNGLAGYCYTTLKAAYEHITAQPMNKAYA